MFYRRSLLYRFLDSFFRHRLIFVISSMTIIVIVGLSLALKPRTYIGGYTVIEDSRILENPLSGGEPSTTADDIITSVGHLQSLISTPDFIPQALRNADGSNLQLDVPLNLSDDTQMTNLRKEITVEASANDAFTVAMEYKDASDIKTILSAIINTYISETAQEKSAYFSEDVAFIQQQVDDYRARLMASEAALTNFKAANADNLPSEQEAIEGEMVSLQSQSQDLQIQLDEDQNTVQYLQAQLAQIPPTMIANQTEADSPLTTQLKTLESQLTTDIVVYQMKESHPQVIMLQQQIAHLKQTIAAMTKNGDSEAKGVQTTDTAPNPLYQSLQQEIVQNQITAKALLAKKASTMLLLTKATTAAARVPAAQRTLANLERDYSTYSSSYNNLMARLQEAQINEQLNLRQATSAYTPLLTSPPESSQGLGKIIVAFAGGVVVAIFLGLTMVVLLEWLDPTLRDPTDTQRVLNLPLLAALPESPALLRGEHPEQLLSGPSTQLTISKAVSG